jgi:hypothetical protein
MVMLVAIRKMVKPAGAKRHVAQGIVEDLDSWIHFLALP